MSQKILYLQKDTLSTERCSMGRIFVLAEIQLSAEIWLCWLGRKRKKYLSFDHYRCVLLYLHQLFTRTHVM